MFDEKIQATALGKFSCNNWKLHDWLPSNLKWYDVLTFKIIESDPDLGSLTIKVKMELQAKADTLGITAGAGLTAEYVSPEIKFGNGGDDMGLPEYYTYYDPINHTIEFQNYGFKMHLK